jgi:ATP-dependent Clp protease ATP-binding subunit ClpX
LEGIKLHFEKEAIEFIADKALEYKLGARGLRSLCEAILTDAMFELPSQKDIKEFIVDMVFVEDKINKSSIKKLMAA